MAYNASNPPRMRAASSPSARAAVVVAPIVPMAMARLATRAVAGMRMDLNMSESPLERYVERHVGAAMTPPSARLPLPLNIGAVLLNNGGLARSVTLNDTQTLTHVWSSDRLGGRTPGEGHDETLENHLDRPAGYRRSRPASRGVFCRLSRKDG